MSTKKAFSILFILFAFVLGCIGGIANTEIFNVVCTVSCLTGIILAFWDYFDNSPPTR